MAAQTDTKTRRKREQAARVRMPLRVQVDYYCFDREDAALQLRRIANEVENESGTLESWSLQRGTWKLTKRRKPKLPKQKKYAESLF